MSESEDSFMEEISCLDDRIVFTLQQVDFVISQLITKRQEIILVDQIECPSQETMEKGSKIDFVAAREEDTDPMDISCIEIDFNDTSNLIGITLNMLRKSCKVVKNNKEFIYDKYNGVHLRPQDAISVSLPNTSIRSKNITYSLLCVNAKKSEESWANSLMEVTCLYHSSETIFSIKRSKAQLNGGNKRKRNHFLFTLKLKYQNQTFFVLENLSPVYKECRCTMCD